MDNKRFELNKNLAQMLKGGVIMDVTTPEQAKIAEMPARVPSWRSSAFLRISALPAAYPV